MTRKWSEEEMLIAVYLYRFGQDALEMDLKDLAKAMDRSTEAIELRLIGLKTIDTNDNKLSGFGKCSELVHVWNKNKDLSQDVLKERISKYLE